MSLAFVVAPEKLIKGLSRLVSIRVISLDWMNQKLLAAYMNKGFYRETVEEIRNLNRERAALMCQLLNQLKPLGISYQKPKGGVYIWCSLPSSLDGREVARLCMSHGLSVIPGYVFYPNHNGGHHHLRLNFSFETEERIKEGVEIFSSVIADLLKNA
jgi:DNA-binding transcriptional MocR family regulator